MGSKKKIICYALTGIGFVICFVAGMQTQKFRIQNTTKIVHSESFDEAAKTANAIDSTAIRYEFIFISNDSTYRFRAIYRNEAESLLLEDETHGKAYILKQAGAASGAKYEDNQGNFFWSKGSEFMWGKGEEIVTMGKLAE